MLKTLLLTFFLTLCLSLAKAQIKGINWIKTSLTNLDGTEVDDSNPLKHSYVRYNFQELGKLRISTVYKSKGSTFFYSVLDNRLTVRSDLGYTINEFLIEKSDEFNLVLIQKGQSGFMADDCLRYSFIAESEYQNMYIPSLGDVLSVATTDTVYLANAHLYPNYKGIEDYFDVLKSGIPEQPSKDLYFLATYVVRKDGHADSLKILESFSSSFDKRIIKNFNRTSKDWTPATLHGKPVSVQMKQEFEYFGIGTMMPAFDFEKKGTKYMAEKDYASALYYFDRGIEKLPRSKEMLYKRAVCKHELGNTEGACNDLKNLQRLGDQSAAALMTKWCN